MRLLQFDNKYLIPLLTNLCKYGDAEVNNDSPDRPPRKSFSSATGGESDDNDGDDEVIEVVRRDVNVH